LTGRDVAVPIAHAGYDASRIAFSLARSLRFALRMAGFMSGATSFEKPLGLPWMRCA
jgi:hypothetical protein